MDMDLVDFQSVVPSLPSGFAIIDNIPGLPVTLDEIWESTSELVTIVVAMVDCKRFCSSPEIFMFTFCGVCSLV